MIQREFRLVCKGIHLISVFEVEEFTKNQKDFSNGFRRKEETKKLPPLVHKEETKQQSDLES